MHKNIEQYMEKIKGKFPLPKKELSSKPKKIKIENIVIPTSDNIDILHQYNYNLQQLKSFVKHYKLKQSGNKNELCTRIYQHLFLSKKITPIQKIFRGHLYRSYRRLRGPGFSERTLCVNANDFLSMEEMKDIPNKQFYSFRDEDNFVYGFDIISLYNLIFGDSINVRARRAPKNPYNRSVIPSNVISDLKKIIRVSRVFNEPIDIAIEEDEPDDEPKSIETRTQELFMKMDEMGHYTHASWFLSLNIIGLRRFVRELSEIWTYRAEITREVKRQICPPNGDALRNIRYVPLFIDEHFTFEHAQSMVMDTLEKLATSGRDDDSRALGVYYILGTLTLVNRDAASAMPWLYESFRYSI